MLRTCLTAVCLLALQLCTFSDHSATAQDRPPRDDRPARPEEVLNHDKTLSADLKDQNADENAVALMPWRAGDDIVDGWDWSLPPGIEPVERSGLIFRSGEKRSLPGNKLMDIAVYWRDVEPEEGVYDFEPLRKKLANPPEGVVGYRFHFYGSVAERRFPDQEKGGGVAPDWLAKYDIPVVDMTSMEGRFQLFNYAIWHPEYHKRYLRVIRAMGEADIPQIDGLRIVYVGGMSKSWGEEMYIPREVGIWCEENAGLTPEVLLECMSERLEAWANAFDGVENKLAWVGAGNDGGSGNLDYRPFGQGIMQKAYQLGMGQRCGFVENYLYQIDSPWLGQSVDEDGYLIVDETCPPIAEGRAFGDENEEYGEYWTGRFGPLDMHRYRYHQSMLRSLQMRRNYLWMSSNSIDMDPALTAYVSLELGRTAADAPDAFCALRESYLRNRNIGREGNDVSPVKNFERWLYQRDRDGGYQTRPAIKASQHEMMWMVPEGWKYDMIARKTDLATGNDKIGFIVDEKFLSGGPHQVAIKVTYLDDTDGQITLKYTGGERTITGTASDEVRTATFFLDDAGFIAQGDNFDFALQATGADATVLFVRLVKVDAIPPGERGT